MNERELRRLVAKETRKVLSENTSKSKYTLKFLLEDDQGKSKEAPTKLDVSKGPSAALAFLNGPGADPRVRALLNSGRKDGIPADEAADVSEGSANLGELVPTQVEIELTKSIAFPLSKFGALKKMISGGVQRIGPPGNDMIVTSGNLIVDGHHRWSSLFSVTGPEGQIASIDIGLPETDAASVLAIVQTAIATTLKDGEQVPKAKAGGMNILGKDKKAIAEMIRSAYESGGGEAGPILTDDFVSSCLSDAAVSKHFGIDKIRKSFGISTMPEDAEKAGSSTKAEGLIREKAAKGSQNRKALAQAREVIIDKVSDNLSKMNQPAEGAPPRVDMPQLDKAKGGVPAALNKLKTGRVNYKTPFKVVAKDDDDEGKTQKESANIKSDVILERWQKMAGLIK